MSSKKKAAPAAKITAGCKVRTNAAFRALFREEGDAPALSGLVLGPHAAVKGSWRVLLSGVKPVQYISERFLEVAQ